MRLLRASPYVYTAGRHKVPQTDTADHNHSSAGALRPLGTRRYPTVGSDCLRTRKRRMVASPDRVLLIGSRSVLATPGDEK